MDLTTAFEALGIALGLGLLVGLQRERVATRLAGLRTFPLITILGTISALLAESAGAWIVAAALMALGAVLAVANYLSVKPADTDPGLTTQVAALVMFCVGAYLVRGPHEIAVAVGGGVAVLLYFKGELHGIAARLGESDLRAMMQLALISLVILPALPNRTYGPYQVLNPRQIWFMVVLIVAISLAAYVAGKFTGPRTGLLVSGILGGLISSTAATASYARRSLKEQGAGSWAAAAILIASAVVLLRLMLELFVVSPELLAAASAPLLGLFGLMAAIAGALWIGRREVCPDTKPGENPAELRWAIAFGLGYGVILLGVAAAKDVFGDGGVYFVAAISGLTDVDAITLSTAQMVNQARLPAETASRVILLAFLANLVAKAALVAALGERRLFRTVALSYACVLGAGAWILLR